MNLRLPALALAILYLASPCSKLLAQKYEYKSKDEELQAERVLDAIGVEPGMVVADVGTGWGYLAWKLAKRVGKKGKVYANDIDKEGLAAIEDKCIKDNINNVVPILGKVDDPRLPEGELDIVTMLHAFHDFTQPVKFLVNLKKSLKNEGIVVVIDWRTILKKERVVALFEEAGYKLLREETFLERDYVVIFKLRGDRTEDTDLF
jgi:ubiquinone/menaquinone biosynthesis C-methylase UbiE